MNEASERVNIPVELENGVKIMVQATALGGPQKVGILDKRPFTELTKAVSGIASEFLRELKKIAPTKASIELGVEVGIEEGKLTALLVQGTTTANLKIVLEWEGEKRNH